MLSVCTRPGQPAPHRFLSKAPDERAPATASCMKDSGRRAGHRQPLPPIRIRIGNEHLDSLITYPDAHNLSGCAQPIRISSTQGPPPASRHKLARSTRTHATPYRPPEQTAGIREFSSLARPQGPTTQMSHAIRLDEDSTKPESVAIPTPHFHGLK